MTEQTPALAGRRKHRWILAAGALLTLALAPAGEAGAQVDFGNLAAAVALPAATVPAPQPAESSPKPFERLSAAAVALRDSIVSMARAQSGFRYVYGGTTPRSGFDCSGLVKFVLAALDIDAPRTAARQSKLGIPIPTEIERLKPGDLLTFGTSRRVSHIGIYVGNGRFVHASTTAGRVIETSLTRRSNPLVRKWSGARRLVAVSEPPCDGGVCESGSR
jgi:cell wall-associated NlpC family hydrolase